jgi:hypothetical protein
MRGFERLLVILSGGMWGAAFFFGPQSDLWILGKWGMFALALSGLLRVTEFLIPGRKPQPKRSTKPQRKCPVCGKPATSGSNFCSYHARYGPEDDRR